MRTRPPALVTTLLSLAVATSCTTTSQGRPRPTPTGDATTGSSPQSSGTAPNTELPYAGAPKVNDPMDTSQFQQDPCQAITADQAQELNVSYPGEAHDGALGKACEFGSTSDRLAYADVRFQDEHPYGLSALYQANEDGKYAFFNELGPIEGYPAISYDAVDRRDTGSCAVMVGVSDKIAFEIALQQSSANVGDADPCETAAMVAGMALRTMKASS